MTQLSTSPDALKAEGYQLFQKGKLEAAIARFEEAASLFRQQDDRLAAAEMWNNIAVAQRRRRRFDDAVKAMNQALAGFQAAGELGHQGQALANLGDVYAAGGQNDRAAECYGEAAALLAKAGDPARQSQVLRALSLSNLRRGRFMPAILMMEQSLSVRPHIGLGGWLFRWLVRLALRLTGVR